MQDLALSSSDSQNILSNPKNKDDSADSIAFLACEAYSISFSILSCSSSICRDMNVSNIDCFIVLKFKDETNIAIYL